MATIEHIDEAKAEEFLNTAIGHFSATMTTLFCAVGDQLGLFEVLKEHGPATSAELAERAGVDERYALEWLRGMASAEYLEHDAETGRFRLPPEHALVLATESGPMMVAGGIQELKGAIAVLDPVIEAFRGGGGVKMDAYPQDFFDGLERFTASWFENLLLGQWMPALPDIDARLREGIDVADLGCGAGRASIKLAQAYPESRFVGYDLLPHHIERARSNAQAAGVADRVTFELVDGTSGLPESFDLITTFDVVHDAVDPAGLVKSVREGLRDGGTYLMLEINCADDPAENVGPLASLFYGFSLFYCMTTSLAHGGAGLGTCGMPEAKVRELCEAAGFSSVERAPIENPFNSLFVARA